MSVCLAGGNVARTTLHVERMSEKSTVSWIRKERIQHRVLTSCHRKSFGPNRVGSIIDSNRPEFGQVKFKKQFSFGSIVFWVQLSPKINIWSINVTKLIERL